MEDLRGLSVGTQMDVQWVNTDAVTKSNEAERLKAAAMQRHTEPDLEIQRLARARLPAARHRAAILEAVAMNQVGQRGQLLFRSSSHLGFLGF